MIGNYRQKSGADVLTQLSEFKAGVVHTFDIKRIFKLVYGVEKDRTLIGIDPFATLLDRADGGRTHPGLAVNAASVALANCADIVVEIYFVYRNLAAGKGTRIDDGFFDHIFSSDCLLKQYIIIISVNQ